MSAFYVNKRRLLIMHYKQSTTFKTDVDDFKLLNDIVTGGWLVFNATFSTNKLYRAMAAAEITL